MIPRQPFWHQVEVLFLCRLGGVWVVALTVPFRLMRGLGRRLVLRVRREMARRCWLSVLLAAEPCRRIAFGW